MKNSHPAKKNKARPPKKVAERTKAKGTEGRNALGQFVQGYAGGPGRPSIYTDELADRICARLAMGETLIGICRDDDMPEESTVRAWALNLEHPFYAKYARARELGYRRMADEVMEICDSSSGGDLGAVASARLRTDTRKWLLSKALPKIYGDKLSHEVTGKDGADLALDASPREVARAVLSLIQAGGTVPNMASDTGPSLLLTADAVEVEVEDDD